LPARVRRITAIIEDPLFARATSVSDNQKTESASGRGITARNVTLHALELPDLLNAIASARSLTAQASSMIGTNLTYQIGDATVMF
jgi:hypothetical protein